MQKKNLYFIIGLLLSSSCFALTDMKTYLASQGIHPPYAVDLKPYIQAALNNDDIRFSGSGSVNDPLVYPTTATITIPEGTLSARRKVIIAADAMIKRLPSEGVLFFMQRFTELNCDSMGTAYKGRIDGNKSAHDKDVYFAEGSINSVAVGVRGTQCLVRKIHVFNNPGTAFQARANNNIIEYCKAENNGYLEIKYGMTYYSGDLDSWAGDSFDVSYNDGNTVRNCESIDAQRWDFTPAHGAKNMIIMDSTGKDVNFSSYGLVDFEDTFTTGGNNQFIRVHNAGGGPNGHGATFAGSRDDHIIDCNLQGTWIRLHHQFPGARLENVSADYLKLGRYGADGDITVTGNFTLGQYIHVANGGFIVNQRGGTMTVGSYVTDEASYYPEDGTEYGFCQHDQATAHIGTEMLLGYRSLITGNWTVSENSVLNFKGLSSDSKAVIGRYGSGCMTLDGSTITEDSGKSVPMAIRWYESGAGSLSGCGRVGLTGWLVNNGKVTANGGVLDLGSFSSVNTQFSSTGDTAPKDIENTTDNGWYAVNGGQLALPAITVGTGNTSVNWGESPADTTLDLVNSVRVNFVGATAGELSIALLARDHAEAQGVNAIGVWAVDFGGSFSSAQVVLRYDDAEAARLGIAAGELKLYRKNGTAWEDVTGSVNTINKRITSVTLSGFSVLAVGQLPQVCGDAGTAYLSYDLTGPLGVRDCYVDLMDFGQFAESWLLSADGYDLLDLYELSMQWLRCSDPANQECF